MFRVCAQGTDRAKLKDKVREALRLEAHQQHAARVDSIADAVNQCIDSLKHCTGHGLHVDVCAQVDGDEPHHVKIEVVAVHPDCCA